MLEKKRTFVRDLTILSIGAALLLVPGRELRPAISQGFCAVMNAVVGHVTFGSGGHVEFVPAASLPASSPPSLPASPALAPSHPTAMTAALVAPATAADAWDTQVRLTDEVTHASSIFLFNARGMGFIPLVLMGALILLTPLERRRIALAGAVGSASVVVVVVAWTSLLLISSFSNDASMNVYQLPPGLKNAIDVAVQTFVIPPAGRYLIPLALGLGIAAWQWSRQRRLAPVASRDHWQELFD